MRGRKPKATAEKEASGAYRKNPQRRNKTEPKPVRGRPVKPEHVESCEVASAQWDELCSTLDAMNILTVADKSLLALYCQTYSEWSKLQHHVRENGCTIFNDKGNASQSAEAIQVHRYADRLLKMMSELGLTPSSRSRIKTPEQTEDEDPMAELLSRIGRG
jgi:P27 family predicted phage terminase small subunit